MNFLVNTLLKLCNLCSKQTNNNNLHQILEISDAIAYINDTNSFYLLKCCKQILNLGTNRTTQTMQIVNHRNNTIYIGIL